MEFQEQILNEYVAQARKIYPNLAYGTSVGSSFDDKVEFNFYNHQQVLHDTQYSPKSINKFIHYTSIDSLFSILNSKEIRLFNLNNLNDKTELKYSANQFNLELNEHQLNHFRNSYFLHSFCQYDGNHLDDFNLWRLYGQNGSGVGIVFEITNTSDKWYQMFLGQVNYDMSSESSARLIEFIQFHKSFCSNHNNFMQNIPTFILILLLFHKNSIWKIENEFRLLSHYEMESVGKGSSLIDSNCFFDNNLFHTITKNRSKTAYLTLPLSPLSEMDFAELRNAYDETQDKLFLKSIPSISITKVILGYDYSDKQLIEITELIHRICLEKAMRDINVEITHLIKQI
jgi:hypothetical protein